MRQSDLTSNSEEKAEESIDGMSIYRSEGWLLDLESSEYLQKRVRRLFKRGLFGDGDIVAYLPGDRNDGQELWHMRYDDGDEEDLDKNEVI